MVSRHRWLTAGVVAIVLTAVGISSTIVMAQEKDKDKSAQASQPVASAPAGMMRFAFGTTKAKDLEGFLSVREGFTPVTVETDYTKEKGFGWVGVQGEAKNDWIEIRGNLRSRQRPGPNDLLAGWITGNSPFTVDVPNGKYIVTTSLGDWGEYEFLSYSTFSLLYQGKEVFRQIRDRSNLDQWFYKHKYDDYEKGLNLFDRYVRSRFDVVTQEVDVTDGKITIQTKRETGPEAYTGTINYVIISPMDQQAAHTKYLADLEALMQYSFSKKYPMDKVREAYSDGLSQEEKDAGYAVIRNPGQKVYPWTNGNNQNHLKELQAYATLGQFEPVDLAIVPLKPLGAVTCECSELAGPNGAKISAGQIKVGYVKYWEVVNKRGRAGTVTVEPYLVIDKNVIAKTEQGVTRQFWITFNVPADAVGGSYKGTVTVSSEKGGTMKFPLTLDVLPIKLDGPGAAMLLNYSFPQDYTYFGDKEAWWADIEKELILQKNYGMNSTAMGCAVPMKGDDVSEWERFIDLYQKVGMDQPIYFAGTMGMYNRFTNLLDPKQQDEYCDVIKKLDAAAKKKNQKVIYSLCDETTNGGREALAALVAKFTHEKIPDIVTIGDINGYRELMLCAPYLHKAGFNNGWWGNYNTNRPNHWLMTRTIIERLEATGCEPWFINGGLGRYMFGAHFWKMESLGLKGKCEWHYYAATSDPYNPFDSQELNAFGSVVFPDRIPTLDLEESRQGINDLCYARTLERIVAEQADTKDPLVAQRVKVAKDALDYWMDQLPDKKAPRVDTSDGSGTVLADEMPPAKMAEFRQEMAYHICRLMNIDCPSIYPPAYVLASWEKGENNGWSKQIEPVAEHASAGSNSGKMTFEKKGTYFDCFGRLTNKNWLGFTSLQFDVFNPQDKDVKLVLSIRDQLSACVPNEHSAQKTITFDLKSGENKLTVPLLGMLDDGGNRPVDTSCIFNLVFTAPDATGSTLFIDNVRLVDNK
jgi:hypothetical protein